MKPFRLQIALKGADSLTLVASLLERPPFVGQPIDERSSDLGAGDDASDLLRRFVNPGRERTSASWDEFGLGRSITHWTDDEVLASIPNETNPSGWLDAVCAMPIELAMIGSPHRRAWRNADYRAGGLFGLHDNGWASVFKGAGHERVVSRRWLDFGPWRTHRRDGDVTVVEFHDIEANVDDALAQARPGHQRIMEGFIRFNYIIKHELDGLYNDEKRRLRIVRAGAQVTSDEMLDACAVRYLKPDPSTPIDHIAYVFPIEDEARAHLHELWLRELECWTIRDGNEVRLDDDYNPTPDKPAWVR